MDGLCRLLKACPNITVKYIVRNWTIPYNSPNIHGISKFKELAQEYILSFVHLVPQHLDGWLADAPDSQTKGEHLKDNLRAELMARWKKTRIVQLIKPSNLVISPFVNQITKSKMIRMLRDLGIEKKRLGQMLIKWTTEGF